MIEQVIVVGAGFPLVSFVNPSEWALHTLIGLSFGLLLFLVASGFTLTFGLARFVNLSHGATYMLAAYTAASVAGGSTSFVFALLAAVAVGVTVSVAVFALTQIRWRALATDPTRQVLFTFGCLLILADQARRQWDGLPRTVPLPAGADGSITIGESAFPTYRLVVMGAAAVVAIGLWWLTERTRFGALVRAGVDDKEQLEALGVQPQRLYLAVFALAGGLAGLAGGLGSPILGASLGQELTLLILALVAVVVGGLGSLGGAFVASLMVGLVDAYGKAVLPQFASFTMMALVIAVLAVRPHGLIARGSVG